jgi:vacuolar-type H+-ATPase subunit E/Vma4
MHIYWNPKTKRLHLTIESQENTLENIISNVKETLSNIKIKELNGLNLLSFKVIEFTSSLNEKDKVVVDLILDTNKVDHSQQLSMWS